MQQKKYIMHSFVFIIFIIIKVIRNVCEKNKVNFVNYFLELLINIFMQMYNNS